MNIPVPDTIPIPLPPFLTKTDVARLFQHWRLGGRYYLNLLVAAGELQFKPRPHIRGEVITSEKIVEFYQSLT